MLNMSKKIFFIIILGLVVGGMVTSSYIERQEETKKQEYISQQNNLKFSNTAVWDEEAYGQKKGEHVFLTFDDIKDIVINPPAENMSDSTTKELELLHEMVQERTDEKIAEIEREIIPDTTTINGQFYTDIFSDRPLSFDLFTKILIEFTSVIMTKKEEFDRVRPNVLDPTLTAVIEVPGHPAYPSGHASQSMMLALVLGDLDPNNKSIYIEDAKRVGRNREIAGVHYASDSEAGRNLALQYHELLSKNEKYQTMLKTAQKEW